MRVSALALTASLLVLAVLPPALAEPGRWGEADPSLRVDDVGGSHLAATRIADRVLRRLDRSGRVDVLLVLDGGSAPGLARDAAGGEGSRALVRSLVSRYASIKAGVLDRLSSARVLRDYRALPLLLLRMRSRRALERAAADPDVIGISPDRTYRAMLSESLPLIRQPAAAAAGERGAGTAVAVLDTGVDYTRPAFGTCITPGLPGCRIVVTRDFAPDDGALDDPILHGTNVAGIVAGVAPDAQILGLDVFDGDEAADRDILAAIDFVIQHQAAYDIRAMNLSVGDLSFHTAACDAGSNPYVAAFENARAVGILPVVAAGNTAFVDGQSQEGIARPACTPGAVSVGAVYDANVGSLQWGPRGDACTDPRTRADLVPCFSQSAPFLTVLAPGALITAAGVTLGGTSQAAPHVAGAAAVLAASGSSSTPAMIESAIGASGPLVHDPIGGLDHHRLDLPDALATLGAPVPSIPTELRSTLQGTCGRNGRYFLYRHGRPVKLRATLMPPIEGAELTFELQELDDEERWQDAGSLTAPVRSDGSQVVTLSGLAANADYRARAMFAGDAMHLGSRSSYRYFRGPPHHASASCGP